MPSFASSNLPAIWCTMKRVSSTAATTDNMRGELIKMLFYFPPFFSLSNSSIFHPEHSPRRPVARCIQLVHQPDTVRIHEPQVSGRLQEAVPQLLHGRRGRLGPADHGGPPRGEGPVPTAGALVQQRQATPNAAALHWPGALLHAACATNGTAIERAQWWNARLKYSF